MNRRLWLWLPFTVVAFALAIFGWNLANPVERRVPSALVGQQFPPVTLTGALDPAAGVDATLLANGRPHLVNVFASWCVPCAAEAPGLTLLQGQGIDIVGIAVHDNVPDLTQFLAQNGNPYSRIGMDYNGRTQIALGSAGVPETFVVDGRGKILRQHIGVIEPDDIATLVADIRGAQ